MPNKLISETSPYLLQHANNPVNWYAWGDEAFEKAKKENLPILLSIGYSTCHWCHVMAHESFEDQEIADYLNKHYVSIKLDREERPDIDAVYMTVVQMMTGHGGWPLNVWLTPELKPFYAGTYFPAKDGDRGTSMGFYTLIQRLYDVFVSDRARVDQQSLLISQDVASHFNVVSKSKSEAKIGEIAAAAYNSLRSEFDAHDGGFGHAPKFPRPALLDFLMQYDYFYTQKDATEMAVYTLKKMSKGGICDQVGGGFHRYSVDHQWLVPHFEKMLYDNAQLLHSYASAYQICQDEELKYAALQTGNYLLAEMQSAHGAFYSATDADSEGEEGKFFVWTKSEIENILGADRFTLFSKHFPVTEHGNFEGHTILTRAVDTIPAEDLRTIERCLSLLYAERKKRTPPLLDDKFITAWNGLAIAALAHAGFVFQKEEWIVAAQKAATCVHEMMFHGGRLYRSFREGQRKNLGFLEDYAFFIHGLLELFQVTSNPTWLKLAIQLQQTQLELFFDDQQGAFFMCSKEHEELLAKEKPYYDGAEPSGNSIAALNLWKLYSMTDDPRYKTAVEQTIDALLPVLLRSPTMAPTMLIAAMQSKYPTRQVVIASKEGNVNRLWKFLGDTYIPNAFKVRVDSRNHESLSNMLPSLVSKDLSSQETAYVCTEGACQLPTSELEIFRQQISKKQDIAS